MKNTFLLIDGNGLLYRAYHAFPKDLTSPTGEPIGAVYGFTRILLTTLKNLKPTSAAVAFDLKGPTFRHLEYDQYKATRQKMPEDLASQIKRTHQIVEFLEFPIYALEGYEADDVIGTIAKESVIQTPDTQVVILTGDQDILQLVTPHVTVLSPGNGTKSPTMFTPEAVQEKYGFTPLQMIEYKALRGDPSDNIPGVPGIGEVTAKKLIAEFGSIETLYQELKAGRAESIKGSIREKLLTGEENAQLSHMLATIVTDVPIDFKSEDCELSLAAPERLIELFKELGFKSLMNDLPNSHRLLSHATDVFSNAEEIEAPSAPTAPHSKSDEIDAELLPILREMETTGVKLDVPYLKNLQKEYENEIAGIKKGLIDLSGEEFNPDSPSQVSHILYEVLSIPTKNIRKGKTGFTTDAATLGELAKEYPIARLLLHYRELTKLLSTYVRPLQEIPDENNRVHTSYAPDTSSGRISSRNPNLQNIPVKTEQGRRIRQAFIASEGHCLVAADYSQIELRVAAHLSGDPAMIAGFTNGSDFHTETATRMGVDRRMAKIINFSILYGKGAYTLAYDLGVTVPEAKQYLDEYFKTYATLRTYLDNSLKQARIDGYTETLYGRRRYYPEINSTNFLRRSAAEREALNMPIQGTAADILKLAMCKLAPELAKQFPKSHMILTVHDELVIEAPESDVSGVAELLKTIMQSAVTLTVPLEVHVKHGTHWGEMEALT